MLNHYLETFQIINGAKKKQIIKPLTICIGESLHHSLDDPYGLLYLEPRAFIPHPDDSSVVSSSVNSSVNSSVIVEDHNQSYPLTFPQPGKIAQHTNVSRQQQLSSAWADFDPIEGASMVNRWHKEIYDITQTKEITNSIHEHHKETHRLQNEAQALENLTAAIVKKQKATEERDRNFFELNKTKKIELEAALEVLEPKEALQYEVREAEKRLGDAIAAGNQKGIEDHNVISDLICQPTTPSYTEATTTPSYTEATRSPSHNAGHKFLSVKPIDMKEDISLSDASLNKTNQASKMESEVIGNETIYEYELNLNSVELSN